MQVEGLFDKPERTPAVRNQLAMFLAVDLRNFVVNHLKTTNDPHIRVQIMPPIDQSKGGYIELNNAILDKLF